jgi:hypothetical protein
MGLISAVIANWLTTKSKTSYRYYYKLYIKEGPLYERILDLLAENADNSYVYASGPDPRSLKHKSGGKIAVDILCFRNAASFYDFSDYGRRRMRIYYDYNSECAVIMCQKKHQLNEFVIAMSSETFNNKSLVFLGPG